MNRLAIAVVLIALVPGAALATQQGALVMKSWQAADRCTKQAQTAFPDFTPDSNAKREAKLDECLRGINMPTRAPLSPPQ